MWVLAYLLLILGAAPISGLIAPQPPKHHVFASSRHTTRMKVAAPPGDLATSDALGPAAAWAFADDIRAHSAVLSDRLDAARSEDVLEMLGYAEHLQKKCVYLQPSARRFVRFAVEVAFLAHQGAARCPRRAPGGAVSPARVEGRPRDVASSDFERDRPRYPPLHLSPDQPSEKLPPQASSGARASPS